MNSKDFKKEIKTQLSLLGVTKNVKESNYIDLDTYVIDTIFGELKIMVDPSPRIKLYNVYMRFTESEKFNRELFIKIHGKYNKPSTFSLKWNLHNFDADYVITETVERVDNLLFLNNEDNLKMIIEDEYIN